MGGGWRLAAIAVTGNEGMPDIVGSPKTIASAASDQTTISGLTHTFYRYPARFSPAFARAAIETFSGVGDVVLDPFMGGGTTVIEAMVLGRQAVGSDINELATFLTRVKATRLTARERKAVHHWATDTVQDLRYSDVVSDSDVRGTYVPKNLNMPSARSLRKTISQCIVALDDELPTFPSRQFARCVLLNVGQWALNGRRTIPTAAEFRDRVRDTTKHMLLGVAELETVLAKLKTWPRPLIRQNDAETLDRDEKIRTMEPAHLVVTSPPYPGIHILYHRWQVDGRKETDAPYWIAARKDGAGMPFYNFADRRREAEDRYFGKAERSFSAVRRVMRKNGVVVQMVAFAEPARQLRRYLSMMERAGFSEFRERYQQRTWREVPSRRWHANLKGDLPSSREVVLIHRAD
jgi:DNA modification methylase